MRKGSFLSAALDHPRRWGVWCADDDVIWVADEAAAYRLLSSLVGAQYIVCLADSSSSRSCPP